MFTSYKDECVNVFIFTIYQKYTLALVNIKIFLHSGEARGPVGQAAPDGGPALRQVGQRRVRVPGPGRVPLHHGQVQGQHGVTHHGQR